MNIRRRITEATQDEAYNLWKHRSDQHISVYYATKFLSDLSIWYKIRPNQYLNAIILLAKKQNNHIDAMLGMDYSGARLRDSYKNLFNNRWTTTTGESYSD